MSMSGYFLRGVNEDNILVFRSDDSEELLRIIQRLCVSRDKQIKALAQQLEVDWNSRNYNKENKK